MTVTRNPSRWHADGNTPRCWGSTAMSGHNSTRKYWWSFRGIHVDPNAPITNKELRELKNMMLDGNFSWMSSDNITGQNQTEWIAMRVPPAPDEDGMTEELIDSQVTGAKESSVASFSIMTMLLLLGCTMLLGLWLKHRRVTFVHQAGAALLLGIAVGLILFFLSLDGGARSHHSSARASRAFV